MRQIQFTYQQPFPELLNRTRLKEFIPQICNAEKHKMEEIRFVFCSDKYLLKINRQFLKHNTYTDIISFNYAKKGEPILGEIYISTDRVKENARILQVPLKEEILRVIFHGVLHFCGYKDKLKADKDVMRAKEDIYIRRYLSV